MTRRAIHWPPGAGERFVDGGEIHGRMITTRAATSQDGDRITRFYAANGYAALLSPDDVIIVAEEDGNVCGALRLCLERDVLVLRGMRVGQRVRRRGIGTMLLKAAQSLIHDRDCYCIPHRHLRDFYTQIGFREIRPVDAPSFLRDRMEEYRSRYGLDAILMQRQATT